MKKLDELLAYWRMQLAGVPDVLALPADRPAPPIPSFSGGEVAILLPQRLVEEIEALCAEHGCTLFIALCAGLMVLLSRYTGQEDFLLGTDLANRTATELEDLLGFFVNVLPLRARLAGDPTFVGFLHRVRKTAQGAYAHQELSFDKLVELISPGRSAQQNPLVQVIFVMQNMMLPPWVIAGTTIELFPLAGAAFQVRSGGIRRSESERDPIEMALS